MAVELVSIGRINIDIVVQADEMPPASQHIIGKNGSISFGGSAANFARQAARLGMKTGLMSCIGDDLYGQTILKDLGKNRVDTDLTMVLENQSTGLFFIVHGSNGQNIIIAEPGANRLLEKRFLEIEHIPRARTVHIAGGFPTLIERVADVTTANGLIFSFDPGRTSSRVNFSEVLRHVDLLFVTEKEFMTYFDLKVTKKNLKQFAKTFPGIVVVKQGNKGAIATDGFEYCLSRAFEVDVVDTLGAGDAFAAGFITAWTRSENIPQALNMANAVAALCITKSGAQNGQPTLEDTERLMKKHGLSIDAVTRTFRRRSRSRRKRK